MGDAVLALGVTLAAFCCAAGTATDAPTDLHADLPVTLCRETPPEDAGGRRPILILHAVSSGAADARRPGQIDVEADTGETTLLGLFPAMASGPDEGAEERRFLLPGGAATRCWTLRLDGNDARAEVALGQSGPME